MSDGLWREGPSGPVWCDAEECQGRMWVYDLYGGATTLNVAILAVWPMRPEPTEAEVRAAFARRNGSLTAAAGSGQGDGMTNKSIGYKELGDALYEAGAPSITAPQIAAKLLQRFDVTPKASVDGWPEEPPKKDGEAYPPAK